jgi:nucleotide-binding universal stress UspA family protein
MKKILVPIDFSEESLNAFDLAIQIGRKTGTEVFALHVLEGHNEQHFNVTGEMDLSGSQADNIYFIELFRKTKKKLTDLIEKIEYNDISLFGLIKTGNIYKRISEIITDEHIDLVVMGSKGSSGIKELLLGSNAEKVIRHVQCPVLTVKEKTDLSSVKKMAFATDLSDVQIFLVEKLKKFVKVLDLELVLLKINTHHHLPPDKAEIHQQLFEYAHKFHLEDADLQVYDDDYIEEGVVRFAEEEHLDIIALGTHGRTGMAHIIAGSVAENIANHAKRLIWTCNY